MVRAQRIGLLLPMDSQWMGGIVYIQNLVKALGMLAPDQRARIELFLIAASTADPTPYASLQPLVDHLCLEPCLSLSFFNRLRRRVGRAVAQLEDPCLARLAQRHKLDFLYPVMGSFGASLALGCYWAGWIPDFQHKILPHLFSATEHRSRDREIARLAQEAPTLVFSSQSALQDFRRFYPTLPAMPVVLRFRTVPEANWFEGDPVETQRRYELPDEFLLVSNQFWHHKNHRALFEALYLLKQQGIRPLVVCTGKLHDYRFPQYGEELLALIKEYEIEAQVRFLGLIPRQDQIQLMRRALAVIQPSLFEGWSTVVEDARLLGKPLILSDLEVHLEQDPPYGYFFARHEPAALAETIQSTLPHLLPGPDWSREQKAYAESLVQCQTYAQEFLKIASTARDRA